MNVRASRNKVQSRIGQRELDRLIAAVGGPRQVEDIYPLSPTQRGLLFHSLYEPESPIYVISVACRLVGALDVEAFERAWQAAVERHGAAAHLRGTLLSVPAGDVEYTFNLKPAKEPWSKCR